MTTTIPAGWLPIESAPKDGTPVLLFARLAGVNFATNSPYAPTIHVGAYRTDLCIWTGSAYRDQREIEIEPTHWMPRPAFPDCAAPGASTAGNPQPARDWELTCHECDGSGHVYVKHQVAERKTDMQEFKEECECCEGRGFVFAFQDIPGIEEYVKACRPAPAAGNAQTAAARDVLAERQRQVEVEQYEPDADDNYEQCELAYAAAAYAITPGQIPPLDLWAGLWPWSIEVFKPTDQRRNLVKAGALILAEIERLDRAAQRKGDA